MSTSMNESKFAYSTQNNNQRGSNFNNCGESIMKNRQKEEENCNSNDFWVQFEKQKLPFEDCQRCASKERTVTICTAPPDNLATLKTKFRFQMRKYTRMSKEVEEKHEALKYLHKKLQQLKMEMKLLNCTEEMEIPPLIETVKDKGDACDVQNSAQAETIKIQKEYNKLMDNFTKVTAIKKEVQNQLEISEKKCEELERQLAEGRKVKNVNIQLADVQNSVNLLEEDQKRFLKEKEEFEKKKKELGDLQNNLDHVNYLKYLAEEENEKLSQINDSLQFEMHQLVMKNKTMEKRISLLTKENINFEENELRQSLNETQEENARLKNLIDKLRNEFMTLQQTNDSLRHEKEDWIHSKEEDKRAICDEFAILVKDYNNLRETCEQNKKEIEMFQQKLREESKEKYEIQEKLNKLKTVCETEHQMNCQSKTGEGDAETDKRCLHRKPSRLLNQLDNQDGNGDSLLNEDYLINQLKSLQKEYEGLLSDMTDKEELHYRQVMKFELKVQEFANESKTLASTIEKFQKNKDKLESEVKILKTKLTAYNFKTKECKCSEYREKLKEKYESIHKLHKKIKGIGYKYQMLKDEVHQSKQSKNNFNSRGWFKKKWSPPR